MGLRLIYDRNELNTQLSSDEGCVNAKSNSLAPVNLKNTLALISLKNSLAPYQIHEPRS